MNKEMGEPQLENKEDEQKFNFEEIEEIEPAILSLIEQLREKIESAEYDTLISDDVGGRIPTLVLRKIIKEINPKQKLKTFFVAGGYYLPEPSREENYKNLQEYLVKQTSDTKKALVVTQFIHTGKTLIRLARTLNDIGVSDFDIATAEALPHPERANTLKSILGENKLYIGNENHSKMHESHEHLGGIRKTSEYSPYPSRMDKVIESDGRYLSEEEWKEIFEIKERDNYKTVDQKTKDPEKREEFERRQNEPITDAEREEIQNNINWAREDVDFLANRVIEKIWNK